MRKEIVPGGREWELCDGMLSLLVRCLAADKGDGDAMSMIVSM